MGPNVELETENGDIRGKHFVLGLGIDRDTTILLQYTY